MSAKRVQKRRRPPPKIFNFPRRRTGLKLIVGSVLVVEITEPGEKPSLTTLSLAASLELAKTILLANGYEERAPSLLESFLSGGPSIPAGPEVAK